MKTTFHVAANLIWYNLILTMTYLHLNLEWFCIQETKVVSWNPAQVKCTQIDNTTLCDKVCQ